MHLVYTIHDKMDYTAGPVVNALRLLPGLRDRGHKVTVLGMWSGHPKGHTTLDALMEQGVECRIIKRPYYTIDRVRWICKQVREVKPDVCVANMSTAMGFAAPVLHSFGVPVISMCRSTDDLNLKRASYFTRGPVKWRSDALVAVSHTVKDLFLSLGPVDVPVYVIPPCVEVPREVADQGSQPVRVVYSGRLTEEQKRIGDMLRAWIAASGKLPHVRFTLLGSGPKEEVDMYRQIVKDSGFEDRIQFGGFMLGERFYKELRNHQISVLLSDYEGLGGAVLDAMVNGLVPLCLRSPSIEEAVANWESGIIVDGRGTEFVHALSAISGDFPLRQKIAVNARAMAIGKYSVEAVSKQWENCLMEVVENFKGRSISYNHTRITLPRTADIPDFRYKPPRLVRKLKTGVSRIRKALNINEE